MDAMINDPSMTAEQDQRIAATVRREGGRLRSFIRRRVLDAAEAEDILQEVLYELVAAHRLMQPIERVGAWLMRIARNRVLDRFRRRRVESERLSAQVLGTDGDEALELADLLPAIEPGPENELIRQVLLEQVEEALEDLPPEQRAVFIAHELEGVSFREMAAQSGISVNTLLARKRYAVRGLRERLQRVYDEWLRT